MFYFITSREDLLTSAIELAQVKRMHIFDYLKIDSKIVTLQYNWAHDQVEKKLGVAHRVINLFQYFQQLPYQHAGDDQALITSPASRWQGLRPVVTISNGSSLT